MSLLDPLLQHSVQEHSERLLTELPYFGWQAITRNCFVVLELAYGLLYLSNTYA